jgi:thioredoxin reductase (NADPH)
MQKQAEHFGARIEYDEVTEVDFKRLPLYRQNPQRNLQADVVIVTAGASPRKLHIPGEDEFVGRGVSYCATCDGFFFRGKDVIVVGGGDSAMEEGLFLTKFANEVKVIHRRDELRAGPALATRAQKHEKINFVWDTVVKEVSGQRRGPVGHAGKRQNRRAEELKTDGVFIFIGHYPNSKFLEGDLAMDEEGYVMTDEKMRTNVPAFLLPAKFRTPTGGRLPPRSARAVPRPCRPKSG